LTRSSRNKLFRKGQTFLLYQTITKTAPLIAGPFLSENQKNAQFIFY